MRIFFLSDFGHRDAYVGVVKAVMSDIAPEAQLIDLAHDLPPQDLRAGAYQLYQAVPHLPEGSIVLAVIDPGVGSSRLPVVVEGKRLLYVAPDNGLLTLAFERDPPVRAHVLEEPSLARKSAARTFDGRDLFGPAAAHLARGVPPSRFGRALKVNELVRLSVDLTTGDRGEVLTFDRFGNAITTLLVRPGRPVAAQVGTHRVPVCDHYAEVGPGEALALVGSAGLFEVSVRDGDARALLGLREGATVALQPAP